MSLALPEAPGPPVEARSTVILSCPTCPSRYRFDEARLPAGGAPVRCKNCRTVFRAMPTTAGSSMSMDRHGEMESPRHGMKAAPSATASMKVKARPAPAEPAPSRPAARARAEHGSGPVSIPVSVEPAETPSQESDIRRLTRIIFSDIVIYGPEKADKAIRQGRFAESYKTEIEEGKKIIRARFPSDTPAALATFQKCMEELLEARKKELQAAVAL